MTAALVARAAGPDALLLEESGRIDGSTALSGGRDLDPRCGRSGARALPPRSQAGVRLPKGDHAPDRLRRLELIEVGRRAAVGSL